MISNAVGWTEGPSNVKLAALEKWAIGNTALDLGCGRGWYASALADKGFKVIGIDQTNRTNDPRLEIIEHTITAPLPFPSAAFNTILLFDIIEHLDDEAGIMHEVARVCSVGAHVLLSVPNHDDAFLPNYSLTYLHRNDRTHVREYRLETIAAHFESFGFRTLYCALQGLPHIPLVFSEFIRGPRTLKTFARYAITALYKIGIVHNPRVGGDIHWVGERR
jgi:2-polyprenyl-3-methyl-5-hydroxy-6-metoxy-1,4-benzoquinol methylase